MVLALSEPPAKVSGDEYPPLQLEKEHFFSLNQAKQLERLIVFIQDCIAKKKDDE
jgi:hypothetical protein